MDDITNLHCKNIILGGDFNIFFNVAYEARGGNPKMINKSVAKFIHIQESLGLCDIWRIRNPKLYIQTTTSHCFTACFTTCFTVSLCYSMLHSEKAKLLSGFK